MRNLFMFLIAFFFLHAIALGKGVIVGYTDAYELWLSGYSKGILAMGAVAVYALYFFDKGGKQTAGEANQRVAGERSIE